LEGINTRIPTHCAVLILRDPIFALFHCFLAASGLEPSNSLACGASSRTLSSSDPVNATISATPTLRGIITDNYETPYLEASAQSSAGVYATSLEGVSATSFLEVLRFLSQPPSSVSLYHRCAPPNGNIIIATRGGCQPCAA
jgi:hypothetical protein